MTMTEITSKTKMQDVLAAYPAAKKVLFDRYHVGGCSSCGYEPTDTLGAVLTGKGVTDLEEAIVHIKQGQAASDTFSITAKELQKLLEHKSVKLLDVRTEEERRLAAIDGDMPATQELVDDILGGWPKDTAIVIYCHVGQRSLSAVMHLSGQGFTNVKSLKGGIDAWSAEIDPLLPRY